MKITRLLAVQRCGQNNSCPAVLALDNGDFLIIGKAPNSPHITAKELIKHSAAIGIDEMAVVIPAEVLHAAARQIVEEASHA